MQLKSIIAAGLAATALIAAPAVGQTSMNANTTMADTMADKETWERVRNNTVSAQDLMAGDVTNGFTMIGNINQLILDPGMERLEYVLYDIPFPYMVYGDQDGFVRWDNLDVERGSSTSLDVSIQDKTKNFRKDELELTRSEAEGRLVEDIISGKVRFSDGMMRGVDDVLFDPETGRVTHFVIEMDDEDLFGNDNRLVPAAMVQYNDQGNYWMVSKPMTYTYEVWIY